MSDTIKDYALAMLTKQMYTSDFTNLEVKKVDDGVCVTLQGQTFGIIGALGAAVVDLSLSSELSIEELTTFIRMAAEVVSKAPREEVSRAFQNKDEMMDFVKKFFNKEGEQ